MNNIIPTEQGNVINQIENQFKTLSRNDQIHTIAKLSQALDQDVHTTIMEIHATLTKNKFNQYYMTNSLVPDPKNPSVIKSITLKYNEKLQVCYEAGSKDEFIVVIYHVDTVKKGVIQTYKFSNGRLFQILKSYADINNLKVNMRSVLDDILAIYHHVNKKYIDKTFLTKGIDQLVQKYPANIRPFANAVYSHCVLAFTSEYYYVNPRNGRPGILGPKLKILGLIKMFNEGLTPKQANDYFRDKNRFELEKEFEETKTQLRKAGFGI